MKDLWTFAVLVAAMLVLAVWSRVRVEREHRQGRRRSRMTAAGVYGVYVLHLGLTTAAALSPRWTISLPEIPSLVVGGLLVSLGVFLFIAGVLSFRSFRRVSGMDTTTLVTTGAYRWSRNPQNLGWSLLSTGIAVMGRSWAAMVLALAFWILFHVYVASEEAFLERLFGRDYREYCRRSHRYFGLPRKPQKGAPRSPTDVVGRHDGGEPGAPSPVARGSTTKP